MTACERYDRDLALHVEGDLPPRDLARLEGHLESCPRCRAQRRELEASQRAVKAFAAEPLPEEALLAVRTRVLAALQPGPTSVHAVPAWVRASAAAGIAALALALGVVWSGRSVGPRDPVTDLADGTPIVERGSSQQAADARQRPARAGKASDATPEPPATAVPSITGQAAQSGVADAPPGTPPVPTGATPSPSDRAARPALRASSGAPAGPPRLSTLHPARPVYGSEGSVASEPATSLTPEEADQLARAVVALSRIESLSDVSDGGGEEKGPGAPDRPAGSTGAFVRWTTADSDIVIYWQLESNGGES